MFYLVVFLYFQKCFTLDGLFPIKNKDEMLRMLVAENTSSMYVSYNAFADQNKLTFCNMS